MMKKAFAFTALYSLLFITSQLRGSDTEVNIQLDKVDPSVGHYFEIVYGEFLTGLDSQTPEARHKAYELWMWRLKRAFMILRNQTGYSPLKTSGVDKLSANLVFDSIMTRANLPGAKLSLAELITLREMGRTITYGKPEFEGFEPLLEEAIKGISGNQAFLDTAIFLRDYVRATRLRLCPESREPESITTEFPLLEGEFHLLEFDLTGQIQNLAAKLSQRPTAPVTDGISVGPWPRAFSALAVHTAATLAIGLPTFALANATHQGPAANAFLALLVGVPVGYFIKNYVSSRVKLDLSYRSICAELLGLIKKP